MSHLRILIHDPTLLPLYEKAIEKFNASTSDTHQDSGFDIYTPKTILTNGQSMSNSLDTQISCAVYGSHGRPQPYYMYPRSSVSKTPFRLANCVGIIDSGYRGHLIGKFDNISSGEHQMTQHSRLLQICSHNLLPFESVTIVTELDDTKRGSGGFGSTGK